MEYKYIKVETFEDVYVLQLDREEKLNALSEELMLEVEDFLLSLKGTAVVKGLFIKGSERAFSAGGDLKEIKMLSQEQAAINSKKVQNLFRQFRDFSFPVVAFVRGICYGGGFEMALHCDFIIADTTTKIALPEVNYALIPGAGGTVLLPKMATKNDALFYLVTGEEIPVEKAVEMGVIQKLVAPSAFDETLHHYITHFNTVSPEAVATLKKCVKAVNNSSDEEFYTYESSSFAALLVTKAQQQINKRF